VQNGATAYTDNSPGTGRANPTGSARDEHDLLFQIKHATLLSACRGTSGTIVAWSVAVSAVSPPRFEESEISARLAGKARQAFFAKGGGTLRCIRQLAEAGEAA
jgi:hypothetical protein